MKWPFSFKRKEGAASPPVKRTIETQADRLDALCAKHGATYERRLTGQQISLCLNFPTGDRICVEALTTKLALDALHERMGEV